MAALQTALQALSPTDFTSVPSSSEDLDTYLSGIFEQTQLILESIPIPIADDGTTQRARSNTSPNPAANASEIFSSAARTSPPPPDRQALQKEWGKPIKLGQKENSLGISVYKTSGKDGRGSWFARRSVHEGLGFNRFKRAFEREFPTSLAVTGAPGEGNIRGIGAERHVEDITAPNQARVEVYQLSAQFPGPTTPRDFVTLLLTSSKALKPHKDGELVPRHFMVVSRPCNHPETQPRDNFIRGQYESVEFIREIPRRLKTSTSSTDLNLLSHKHGHPLEQDVLINAHLQPGNQDAATYSKSRDASPGARKRSHTVGDPALHASGRPSFDEYDPEDNPIEWIMVTRSDPGGSVPRFLVDRGTPGSICADAVKFLDWACSLDDTSDEIPEVPSKPRVAFRRESFTSFAGKERFPDIEEDNDIERLDPSIPQTTLTQPTPNTPTAPQGAGIFASVAGAFSNYAPQTVLDHLPGGQHYTVTATPTTDVADDFDDASSSISSTSFASADSHLSRQLSLESPTASMVSQSSTTTKPQTAHEKELAKLTQKRAALEAKHAATRTKLESQNTTASAKEAAALKKAEEKHEKELKKQEERYKRELEKLEQRKQREERKTEQRKKRAGEKDEKDKFRRERDELKDKVEVLEREAEVWMRQVGDLQRENTRLMARIGKLEGNPNNMAAGNAKGIDKAALEQHMADSGESLSRSSTPTPSNNVSGGSLAASASSQERRNPSEENLKRLSSRVRTLTFNSLGMGDRLKQENGEGGEGGNRSRSSSLFRRRKEGELSAEMGGEKASVKSEGSATS